MPFEAGKNSDQLGIDKSRKFRVVIPSGYFKVGDLIVLKYDNETICPYFYKWVSDKSDFWACCWSNLEYADEPKTNSELYPTIMSTLFDVWRRLTLTPEDNLMIQLGLENPQGVPTDLGMRLWMEMRYQKDRADVIAEAKKIKAEQDKEKAK
jgi:hypothetical protein